MRLYLNLVLSLVFFFGKCKTAELEARCQLKADAGDATKPIKGVITLLQKDDGPTTIEGTITGFDKAASNEKHGFHIHDKGDLGEKCVSAGGHYNPFSKEHGAPTDTERHVGDLGNIVADSGKSVVNIEDSLVKLSGDTSVIGRAIVVHAGEDDLGKGGDEESKKTGNAGSRLSCCVITEVQYVEASCSIAEETGDPAQKISGEVEFKQESTGGALSIKIDLKGFNMTDVYSDHGFHIHANGATGNACKDAGGHFNPFNKEHGAPEADERHVGDLGNVQEDGSGNVKVTKTDNLASLTGTNNILGKSIVVHAKADDLGLGGKNDSKTTGAAGGRLGCCIIKSPVGDSTQGSSTITFTNWLLSAAILLSLIVLRQ